MLSKKRRNYNCAILLFIAIYPFTHLEAASFQGLGILTSVGRSKATAISSDGTTIVGYSYNIDSSGPTEAFRWTIDGGMMGLGMMAGGSSSMAHAASEDGTIIVGVGTTYVGDVYHTCQRAFRWTEEEGMRNIGCTATGSNTFSGAFDISDDGSRIVGWGSSSTYCEAFSCEDGTITTLGYLPGNSTSQAWGISGDGLSVVGRSSEMAFCYKETSMVALGDLPGGTGIVYSTAIATSYDGDIIVGQSRSTSYEAFVWQNNIMIGLGDLAGGHSSSASDVSADGSIVVGHAFSGNDYEAFIWNEINGMRNVKDMLINGYGLDLTGWTLREATGISSDGTVICGNGINPNGYDEAWIATIPEPSAFLLIGFGVLFIKRGRRVPPFRISKR